MGLFDKILGSKSEEPDVPDLEELMQHEGDVVSPPADFYVKRVDLRNEGDGDMALNELTSKNIIILNVLPLSKQPNRLKGIISVRDLLRAFINVLGIGQPGTLLCVLMEEKIGQLKKIVDAITEMNVSFGSILVARYWEKDMRAVFPYLLTQNVAPVKRRLGELGYTLLDPMEWYMDQLPQND